MEIEAKFSIPDLQTFKHFQAIDQLADFVLEAGRTKEVHDTYVDTVERKTLAAGYACRIRKMAKGVQATLKGLGGAEGAVHRREELEVELTTSQPPEQWPAGPLRDRVLQLTGQAPLLPLFELHQARTVRPIRKGGQVIAELSLDDVSVILGDEAQTYLELEVELTSQGDESDLAAIVAYLQDEWNLEPESQSKFERALALMDSLTVDRVLMPQERALCAQIAERDDWHGRRARAFLALDAGVTLEDVSRLAERTARTVRRWLAAFREQRLAIFPLHVLKESISISQLKARKPKKRRARQTIPTPPSQPGLEVGDSMAEAARKTLYFHFQRMLYHEPSTRLGEDIEALHDMRVATRRMRAALQVFGDYLDLEQMSFFTKGLRRTGRTLGAVRDLDVFWEKTRRYLDTLPQERRNDLAPLRAAWETEHKRAREKMLVYLDSDRYRRFKERFGEFLQTPEAGALPPFSKKGEPLPHRLQHVAPVIAYQRLATVRAYDEWVTGPDVPLERLHQLRIAAKGLRYTLEFLQEVLGDEAKPLIKEIKSLQDHLGDLQDAVIASNLLRDFLTWGTWGHARTKSPIPLPTEPIVAPGVAAYLAARQAELQHLLDTFPQTWERVQCSNFDDLLVAALATL
jgi:CHAD domain-containing protein